MGAPRAGPSLCLRLPDPCAPHALLQRSPSGSHPRTLSVHSWHTARSGWGTLKLLRSCKTDKCSLPRMADANQLLRKLMLLEQLLQIFAGFGFTVTSFSLSQLFIEAKPASKSVCYRLLFWTMYKHSFYPYAL